MPLISIREAADPLVGAVQHPMYLWLCCMSLLSRDMCALPSLSSLQQGGEHTHLRGNRADEKKEHRGAETVLLPIDQCSPIQTDGERSLFFTLHQDPACKNRDGSDNFLVMAGRFNMEYSRQVRHMLNQVLTAGPPVLAMQIQGAKDACRLSLPYLEANEDRRTFSQF